MNRLPVLLTATMAMALGASATGRAQIMYPAPYRYAFAVDASVRIEATPKEAEVYVDGFYAGIVDDFDGVFQRLRLEPGQHEIVLYMEGYRSAHERVYLMPDRTFHIRQRLERLGAGESAEARPVPAPPQFTEESPQGPPPREPRPFPGGPGRAGRGAPLPPNAPPAGPPANGPSLNQSSVGTLSIQLQPIDADVLIDGQPWPSTGRADRFVVDVTEGRHAVQIRKAGYVGYLTEVEVRRGETTSLNVTLRAQP
jgi:hypothetical protein